jgi:hypothetical protein
MIPTIADFERPPDRGKGLASGMRVRWALEEVNQPYDVRLVSCSEMKEPAYRALYPFGQIPTFEEGDLTLFESRPIVVRHKRPQPGTGARWRRCVDVVVAGVRSVCGTCGGLRCAPTSRAVCGGHAHRSQISLPNERAKSVRRLAPELGRQ